MQNFNTLLGYVFLTLVISYITACLYSYLRIYKSIRRQLDNRSVKFKNNLGKVAILIVTIPTLFVVIRWSVEQYIDGCTNPFFWNMTCYDISQFNHIWNSIVILLGANVILFAFLSDIRRQDRANGK